VPWRPPQAATTAGDHSGVVAKGTDERGNYADFSQPWGSASLPMRSDCEGVSGAKLSHPPLLY
jgi:hypothetical protein